MVNTFPYTFFAYLDLLGFSRFVLNLSDHPDYKNAPEKKQQTLLYYYNVLEPMVNGSIFSKKGKKLYEDTSIFQYPEVVLNSMIVSDSIFLWTDDQTIKSFTSLLYAVKHIINTNILWDLGFPLRGGIAMGSISYQRMDLGTSKINSISTLVGDALVKAAALEKQQNWTGCVIEDDIIPTLQETYPDRNVFDQFKERNLITKYNAPMKDQLHSGNQRDYYSLIWPDIPTNRDLNYYTRPIEMTFERNGEIIEEDIKLKLSNTLQFIQFLQKL